MLDTADLEFIERYEQFHELATTLDRRAIALGLLG
jgi:hypothetical protein